MMTNGGKHGASGQPVMRVTDLTFTYNGSDSPTLRNFNLELPEGSRCLLIGQNGAGKSTLLRILAGRHLTSPDDAVVVLGKDSFRDTTLNKDRSFLSMDWGTRTVSFAGHGIPLQADIAVSDMMKKDQERYPERRDEIIRMLGVDPTWRMHQVSDGQRRRVQLLLGLVRPFKLLLLDEITANLDVIVRQDLLLWLRRECEERGATIVYATHIFDGLDDWPTHLTYMKGDGSTGWQGRMEDLDFKKQLAKKGETATLLKIACHWLRGELEQERAEAREDGARREAASGDEAVRERNPNLLAYVAGGGYAPGRLAHQGI